MFTSGDGDQITQTLLIKIAIADRATRAAKVVCIWASHSNWAACVGTLMCRVHAGHTSQTGKCEGSTGGQGAPRARVDRAQEGRAHRLEGASVSVMNGHAGHTITALRSALYACSPVGLVTSSRHNQTLPCLALIDEERHLPSCVLFVIELSLELYVSSCFSSKLGENKCAPYLSCNARAHAEAWRRSPAASSSSRCSRQRLARRFAAWTCRGRCAMRPRPNCAPRGLNTKCCFAVRG